MVANCQMILLFAHGSMTFQFKNFGEKIGYIKTKDLKNFLYPVKEGVKFIPEIWFYIKVSNAGFKFAYIQNLFDFFDDASDNRLSRSSIKTCYGSLYS